MTGQAPDTCDVGAITAGGRHAPSRRAKELVAYAIVVFAIAILAFGAGRWWLEVTKWDPLGDYPVQVVSAVDQAVPVAEVAAAAGIPTFYLDQTIRSEGVKCVKVGEGTVTVMGTLSWVSDEPRGQIIEVSNGGGRRGPSCINYSFENRIPDAVLEEIDRLTEAGIARSTWHLSGAETPVRPSGERGVQRTWITTSFVLIHREAP